VTAQSEDEKPTAWIGTVSVVGPNFVAARNLEREGWVAGGDLGPTEYQGAFFCKLFGANWKAIERKTAITPEEVDRAETLGAELLRARRAGRARTGAEPRHARA
jgi:hypothetical protein